MSVISNDAKHPKIIIIIAIPQWVHIASKSPKISHLIFAPLAMLWNEIFFSGFLSLINLLFDTFHRLLKLQFFWVINSFWWLVCLTFWTSIRSSFFSSKRGLVEVQHHIEVSLVVVMHKFALPLYLPCIVKTLGLV